MSQSHSLTRAGFIRAITAVCLLATAAIAPAAATQPASQAEIVITPTATPPVIDGRLDDAAWKSATPLERFWPADKAAAQSSHLTMAWMTYDDENLYIAFGNSESRMDEVRAKVTQHDGRVWTDDANEVFIVPPEGTGVHLIVNILNTQADLAMTFNAAGDLQQDSAWNGPWQSAVVRASEEWTVEIKIPFTTLKTHPKAGQVWKINLCRERYADMPEFWQWNVAGGGFANVEKFASLQFGEGRATLKRFVEDLSHNPLEVDRPDAQFQSLLTHRPGHYVVGGWTSDMFLTPYPESIKKQYTTETWKPRAYEILQKWGEVGMEGPAFPWVSMDNYLGWDLVKKLHRQYGMRFRMATLYSVLQQRAREKGAKWVYPGMGSRVSIIDPLMLEEVESAARQWIQENPQASGLISHIEGIDEPSNGLFATFSPTKRPEMKADLEKLDGRIREEFGHGKYGLYDQFAPIDDTTPFKRIAFLKWWNHDLGEAIGRLQRLFQELTPGIDFMGFDVNTTGSLNPTDVTTPARYSDWVSTDPYPTKTLALYGPGRARYHTGFSTKLVRDLSGGRPIRVICQGFTYYGRGMSTADAREWASQAMKNGADELMWYIQGPALLTMPDVYEEIIRINGVVHKMNRLALPAQTHTAIFFSQTDRWARDDEPMDAAYTVYALLGEQAGAWFNFVSDTQLTDSTAALNDYNLIYVPSLQYVDRPVAQRLIKRARAGATLVIFDPQAFTWDSDGTRLTDLRRQAGGATLGEARQDTHLTAVGGEQHKMDDSLPLTPLAVGRNKGHIEAFTLGNLPEGAQIVARYADGSPAAYRVKIGEGSVIWFAAQPFGNANLALQGGGWVGWLTDMQQQAEEKTGLPIWNFLIPPADQTTAP